MLVPRCIRLITVYLALGCLGSVGHAASPSLPFRAGEELTYKVSWLGIAVGTATMRIESKDDVLRLVSQARNLPFFNAFYKVDDHIESLFDPRALLPRFFRMRQHEGKYQNHYEMVFDQPNRRVTYHKRDKPPRLISTTVDVQDPLSVLYLLRTMHLPIGQSISVPIFNRDKMWITEVRILKRERLQLPVGTIDTIKVQPLLRDAGVFRQKGRLYLWLTDDAQRVPVQMRSSIMIGAITARLVQAKGVELVRAADNRNF